MSPYDERDDTSPSPQPGEAGRSTGTGWAQDEPDGSLAARLAHLAQVDRAHAADAHDEDDDEIDVLLPFEDEDDLDEDELAAAYDDGPDPLAVLQARRGQGRRVSVATVAGQEVLPTSVPGVRAGRRRARRGTRRVSLPLVGLVIVTLLASAFAASLWWDVRERTQAEDARRAGLDASRDAARLLFSYDYRTLDKDFATGRRLTTGSFRSDYDKTTTKVVADVAKRYRAVVKANVVNAGVVSASPTSVVTVVYVNQVTTSTQVKGQKVDLSRVRMTLVKDGDVWLVTKVDAL